MSHTGERTAHPQQATPAAENPSAILTPRHRTVKQTRRRSSHRSAPTSVAVASGVADTGRGTKGAPDLAVVLTRAWACRPATAPQLTDGRLERRLLDRGVRARRTNPDPVSGLVYREARATRNRAHAAQVVANWIQLIVKYFCRPDSQSGGIASGSQANITL